MADKRNIVYRYLGEDELPSLWLALDDERSKYTLSPAGKVLYFEHIEHQCSGHACDHIRFYGAKLTPKRPDKLKLISKAWLESDVGCLGISLKDVVEYEKQLSTLFRVSCDRSFSKFREAVYPIDPTEENLKRICKEKLPSRLDDLLLFDSSLSSIMGCIGRWNLYILGENCD